MIYRAGTDQGGSQRRARVGQRRGRRLKFSAEKPDRLTHYLFRYPAKFHPPVIRALIEKYSEPGDWILDPFCGSGTSLVEASVLGRNSIGTDVDPLAVFMTRVKTRRLNVKELRRSAERLLKQNQKLERSASEYDRRKFQDLSERVYRATVKNQRLRVPNIPNIEHWFRRYVIVDLARLQGKILELRAPQTHRDFLLLCFASIIRGASNADPVPVSGLEVTKHMLEKDAKGRVINPFELFTKTVLRSLDDMEQFIEKTSTGVAARSLQADATELSGRLNKKVSAVITSPPYHGAVDYYRRHTLEMFWLGLVGEERHERLALLSKYIGRTRVPQSHRFVSGSHSLTKLSERWEKKLRIEDQGRADAFRHYMVSMRLSVKAVGRCLPRGRNAVFVLGKNSWNGSEMPTTRLFEEICEGMFELEESYWYPIRNRYMRYTRHNGADINREYVLVMRRK